LVDIRHTPSSDDQMMYQWIIGQDKPNLVVATKLDKIPRGQIQKKLRDIRVTLGLGEGDSLLPFSAETKQGRDEIWNQIRENSPKPRMNTNKRE